MGVITALERQKRNKERVNVYLDGEYRFSLNLLDAAQLHKGQHLTDDEIARLCAEDAVIKAADSAVRFLAHRPRSVHEVRRNLQTKKFDDAVIDAAIDRLNALGYLDDEAFARYWVENRTLFNPLGPAALRYELRQKGVPEAIIQSALVDTDPAAAAYQAAESQVRRLRGSDVRTFRNKISSFLQRRGFSYAVIREAVDQHVAHLREQETGYFAGDAESDDGDVYD
jgi:regulatory protein